MMPIETPTLQRKVSEIAAPLAAGARSAFSGLTRAHAAHDPRDRRISPAKPAVPARNGRLSHRGGAR